MEGVSKKLKVTAGQDYIWRYLMENSIEFGNKRYEETWKHACCRNRRAIKHISEKLDYLMCPIRHFKELVTHVDSF